MPFLKLIGDYRKDGTKVIRIGMIQSDRSRLSGLLNDAMCLIKRPDQLPGFMNYLQIFIRDGWLALERVVSRSPNPNAVFADAGY